MHPKVVPKCSCGGRLAIVGEMKEGGWRVGFRVVCKDCGRRWKYLRGSYYEDEDNVDRAGAKT